MRRIALFTLAFILFGSQTASVSAQEEVLLTAVAQSGYEENMSSVWNESGDTELEEETDSTEPEESESEGEEETEPTESEESEPEGEEETEPTESEESEPEGEEETEPTESEESEPEGEEEIDPVVPEEGELEGEEENEPTVPEESTSVEEISELTTSDEGQEALRIGLYDYTPYEGAKYSLTYFVSEGYVTIQKCNANSTEENWGDLVIPNEINGYPVKRISSAVFAGCKAFNGTLTLPESLEWIGPRAFEGCSGLRGTLTLPSGLTGITDRCFQNCSGFSGDLVIPDNITSIAYSAFLGCSGFDGTLTLPSGLTELGEGAFGWCSGLKGDLTIPDGLTTIPATAFRDCSGFDGTLTLPNSVTEIEWYAFSGCSGLSGSLIIPNSITKLEQDVFSGCSGFNGSLVLPEHVTEIGVNAFSGCKGFSGTLTLPDSLTQIGNNAFSNCSGFDGNLRLPGSVEEIGKNAFAFCSGLKGDLVLPGATDLGENAFLGCSGFDGNLIIPEGQSKIPNNAFRGCENIKNISIPGSVTTIGSGAFWGCTEVVNIYYEGNKTQWDSIMAGHGGSDLKYVKMHFDTYYSSENIPPTFENNDKPVAVIKPTGSSTPVYAYRNEPQVYRTWADTVDSYLYDNGNGLTRVEFCNGKVVIENYDSNFNYQAGWTLEPELPIWGGFYAGEKYNFLIFGQENSGEDNNVEVIRVVKYDKAWNRLNHASLRGANTTVPFDAGSLRCDEYNGMLYVHTSHEMYTSSDGYNHQANLTFSVREIDMWITDQISEVSSVRWGYVSHSFNQFLLTDKEGNIITLDHGDAYPRAAVIIRYNSKAGKSSFSNEGVTWVELFEFPGERGDNKTNASIGGLAETDTGYIAAYNYSPNDDYKGIRNIHISYLPRDSFDQGSVRTWTSETAMGTTPVIASTGADGGYVLWRNLDVTDGVQYVHYDAQGNISLVKSCNGVLLSDCQPVLYQGNIVWYATSRDGLVFYTLNDSGISVHDPADSGQSDPNPPTPNPPAPDQSNEDQVRSFVSRMYTVALGRDAEPQGLNDWTSRLLSHKVDGSGIANGFIMSDEFKNKKVSDEVYVDTLYRTFFDRDPDTGGKATWLEALDNGNSREYVLAGFVNSVEFDDLCGRFGIIRGTMENSEKAIGPGVRRFVNRCYLKVLGREGEPAGVSDWTGRIARSEETPESTAKLFFFSEEYANKNTSNEEFVETLYQTFMDRASDPAGKSDWLGRLAAGISREEVLEGFSRSEEFADILKSFGL